MSYSIEEISYTELINSWDISNEDLCFELDWQQLFPGMKYFCVNDKVGNIQAAFALYFSKRKGLRHVSNMPYFPHIGLVMANQTGNVYEVHSKTKRILSALADYMSRFSWFNITLPTHVRDLQPFIWNDYSVSPRYTYRLDITPSLEELQVDFSKALRSDYRKIRELDISYSSELTDTAWALLEQSTFKHRNSAENLLGRQMLNTLVEKKAMMVVVAEHEHDSGVACLSMTSNSATYLFGGSTKSPVSLSTAALIKAIEQSKDQGIKVFDFEGSMIPGVEKYFRSFGAQITPYYQVKKEPVLIRTTRVFG